MRGVAQYLPHLEKVAGEIVASLRPGGFLAVLANPNANSYCYRKFGRHPALESSEQGKEHLHQVLTPESLKRVLPRGVRLVKHSFPYLSSPYANPLNDFIKFCQARNSYREHAWPRNIFNSLFFKP
jgi:hypothetical protein